MSERVTCSLCGNPDAIFLRVGGLTIIGCKCREGCEPIIIPTDVVVVDRRWKPT